MPSSNDITSLDFVIGFRDTSPCVITLTDDDGAPRDLTGNTYLMHVSNIRYPANEAVTAPDFFWDITPVIVNMPGTDGLIQFSVSATDYLDLAADSFNDGGKVRLFYDIVEVTGSLQRTILEGKLTVQRAVHFSP